MAYFGRLKATRSRIDSSQELAGIRGTISTSALAIWLNLRIDPVMRTLRLDVEGTCDPVQAIGNDVFTEPSHRTSNQLLLPDRTAMVTESPINDTHLEPR